MSGEQPQRRGLRAALTITVALGIGGLLWWGYRASRPTIRDFPLSPIASSEFRNTSAEVQYVGSAACAECHDDLHAGHFRTPHGQAMAVLPQKQKLPEATVRHGLSGRHYRTEQRGSELWHREWLERPDGSRLPLAEHQQKYVIGSGNHAFTYLYEADGFLAESPLTWFTPQSKWDLSPGYRELVDQPGFSRPVDFGCVTCHSGGATPKEQSPYRMTIFEHAIGCERCHGPGQLHVAARADGDHEGDGPDPTIVHPAHLDRERQESICAQCHLEGATRVRVRGRTLADFRPGLRLADFEATYQPKQTAQAMRAVGHVEQMRLSPCYQKSDSLTCISCHNPHDRPTPETKVEYYRARCLACHAEDDGSDNGCGLAKSVRLQRNKQDDCAACHMPQSPINVVHVAFTHHRIGIHPAAGEGAADNAAAGNEPAGPQKLARPPEGGSLQAPPPPLVPLDDLSTLHKIDRERCLGLGYMDHANKEADVARSNFYARRAEQIFLHLREQGLRDPDVDSNLARIKLGSEKPDEARALAQSVLQNKDASPHARIEALDVTVAAAFELQDFRAARDALLQLVAVRRDADDWGRLAASHYQMGDKQAARDAARKAVTIAPYRAQLHEDLARILKETGASAEAARHEQHAADLRQAAGR